MRLRATLQVACPARSKRVSFNGVSSQMLFLRR